MCTWSTKCRHTHTHIHAQTHTHTHSRKASYTLSLSLTLMGMISKVKHFAPASTHTITHTHTLSLSLSLMHSKHRSSVRISEDCSTVVVGAFGTDQCGVFSGASYVYLVNEMPVQGLPPVLGRLPGLVQASVVCVCFSSFASPSISLLVELMYHYVVRHLSETSLSPSLCVGGWVWVCSRGRPMCTWSTKYPCRACPLFWCWRDSLVWFRPLWCVFASLSYVFSVYLFPPPPHHHHHHTHKRSSAFLARPLCVYARECVSCSFRLPLST